MCQHARGRSIRLPLIREAEDRTDSLVPIGLLIHAVWGALVSDGQFATNPNASACIDFREGPGSTGMLIGLTSRRFQPTPYTNGQDRERDPLVLYGQPFMISANDTDTGNVVKFFLEGWTLERGVTLLPTQTAPVLLRWTPPLILQRLANIHTSS